MTFRQRAQRKVLEFVYDFAKNFTVTPGIRNKDKRCMAVRPKRFHPIGFMLREVCDASVGVGGLRRSVCAAAGLKCAKIKSTQPLVIWIEPGSIMTYDFVNEVEPASPREQTLGGSTQ
jgi:hypothetical protein